MPNFDWLCRDCKNEFEAHADPHQDTIVCDCGGVADKIWVTMPCVNMNAHKYVHPAEMNVEAEIQQAEDLCKQ